MFAFTFHLFGCAQIRNCTLWGWVPKGEVKENVDNTCSHNNLRNMPKSKIMHNI
jgi:hypothetical protein